MQFRIQGHKIQCIRSTYDSEIKRSRQKVVASFDRWADKIPSDGLDDFTPEEHEELKVWWANRQSEKEASFNRVYVRSSTSDMARMVRSISTEDGASELTEELASSLWEQITELQKALRKAGFPRPKASKAKPAAKAAGQGDLLC